VNRNDISLSIILPTIGRDTLARTLMSIDNQIEDNDEVIIVADERGNWQYAEWLWETLNAKVTPFGPIFKFFKQPTGKPVGQPLRNFGIEQAERDYIVWTGDDDVFTPDAFDAIKTNVCKNPDKVHLFRWDAWQCGVAWREKVIKEGNIGDHSIVAPNDQSKLGRFTMRYAGDYDYIVETVNNFGGEENVIWCQEILTICRPERHEKKKLI